MSKDRKRSQQQEKRLSQKLGGSLNSGSGNGWVRKNDVRTSTESVEAKTTKAKQYTLKLSELQTAEKYALLDDRYMVFALDIAGHNYVILTEDDYENLRHLANEYVDINGS